MTDAEIGEMIMELFYRMSVNRSVAEHKWQDVDRLGLDGAASAELLKARMEPSYTQIGLAFRAIMKSVEQT